MGGHEQRNGRAWLLALALLQLGCAPPSPQAEPQPQGPPQPSPELPSEPASAPAPAVPPSAPPEHFHPFAPGFIDYAPPFDGEPLTSELREGALQIEDFVLGTGDPVGEGSYVTFHYVGYLDDGYVYDSTRRRNRPHSFFIGGHQVIEGWDRGLRGMRVGGQRRLHVPAALAFGERGRPQVPPGAGLVFTVELLAARGPFAAPTPAAELRALERESAGAELRAAPDERSRAAATGDRLFVHLEHRDPEGRVRESTHRLGVPRLVQVAEADWTAELRGLRVGGIRRVRSEGGTHIVELLGFD